MNSRSVLQTVIGLATVTLLLAGCGPQETAPAATPVAEAPAATSTITPVPPTPTPGPTATPVPPTATPIPPTATPTGGLSVGATFVLGPATVDVIRFEESTTSPVFEEPPQRGMKFVLVELEINQLQSGEELASDRMFLENASGKQYGPPKVYGKDPTLGKFEGESQTIRGGREMNLFFEVAENENLDMLKLLYH
jgi:hypothetical protein